MSLLEDAKKMPYNRACNFKITDEMIEVVVAYIKKEITQAQAVKVLFYKDSSGSTAKYLYRFAIILREAYLQGKIDLIIK